MNNVFEYVAFFIPPAFVALSEVYRVKFNKLKNSGKIPDLVMAKQRRIVFMVMAIFSVLIIIVAIQF